MQKTPFPLKEEEALMRLMASPEITDDPYTFVMTAFPWGKAGTPLARFKGPRPWQEDELKKIGAHIRTQKANLLLGIPPEVYKSAIASGRGPGKSALVAWLNLWMMTVCIGALCINTANTETQLKEKTWAELGKWHTLAINSHWFERMALSLKPAAWFKQLVEEKLKVDTGYYYAAAVLWAEDNPDAFAGAHNFNGTLLVYDEASGIPQPIWDVSEGFFTELVIYRLWLVFSNPRRNTGPFFECFHRFRKYWPFRRNIDSRTIEGIDLKVLNDIIEKYGIDSDQAKIEVLGQFPSQSEQQMIGRDVVEGAVIRNVELDEYAPLHMGVDPARGGGDETAIVFRRGRDARSIPIVTMDVRDNMVVANECARLIDLYQPDTISVDAGNGTGIIDRLKEMKYKVNEVWFGSTASKPEYENKRTELWAEMEDWLRGGMIPDDQDLRDDLVGPRYDFVGRSDKKMLESKEDMAKRGLDSPDKGDALACTFFARAARKDAPTRRDSGRNANRQAPGSVDYDPLSRYDS